MVCSRQTLDAVPDQTPERGPRRVRYGSEPKQFGELRIPRGGGPHPIVVFIHGGFWRSRWDLALARPQAEDIVEAGFAAWNIEYRGVGDSGGGFPGTFADVAAAIDHLSELAEEHRLDLSRVAVVGHSAGGHLALWLGQRGRIEPGAVGSSPLVVPRLSVGQAPVSDLGWAFKQALGSGAVVDMMGRSPDEGPADYAVADPARLLPPAVAQLIVHGDRDDNVPIEATRHYARLVADDGPVPGGGTLGVLTVEEFEGADHFDVIDPSHRSWLLVKARITEI